MTPPTTDQTRELHELYCQLTKLRLRYTMHAHFMWEAWSVEYTKEDLALVIAYIWRRIRSGHRQRESFKLSSLIGSPDRFEEDLSMARCEETIAQKQAKRPAIAPGKASVLRATGRATESPKANPEAVAAIVAQCLEKMRRDIR